MAKLSKFVKNNLFTEVGGFILDARQAKVLYDLINQITGGGSYLMVGEIAVTNISDLNAPEFLLKEPGNYGLNITDGFEGHQNMNLNIAFNSTSTSGSIGLQDILQTIMVGEKVYTRTLVHTQMGESISLSYGEWADSTLPSNRFVSLQEKSFVQPYTIGQLAEGGIIFYILQDGDVGYDPTKQKGLVVSPVNQGIFAWNNEEYVLTGADKTTIGYGYSNSVAVVIAQTGTVYNYAARKCIDLVLGGYSDWYLPTMGELLKLYANRVEAGIIELPVGLWSSSEYDLNYAVLVYNATEYNTTEKNQQWQVRAIRSFSVDLSLKSEEDGEIMVSTGNDKEIKGSGKKLSDLMASNFSEVTKQTISERDEYKVTKLPTNVLVIDDGDGKWALYKATTTGVNATYIKLSDPDLLNAAMSALQIAASYESIDDVNRFTDELKAKLDAFTANFTEELKATYDGKISPKLPEPDGPYTIGQAVEGGIVFYILQPSDIGYEADKQKCLIAATTDQSEDMQWYANSYVTTNASHTEIGYGLLNTGLIVGAQGTTAQYAARLCSEYTGGGYTDWYLGTTDEMLKLVENWELAGLALPRGSFWTSSETDQQHAMTVYPDMGMFSNQKDQLFVVRAIRTAVINVTGYSFPVDGEIIVASGNDGKEVKGSGKTIQDLLDITGPSTEVLGYALSDQESNISVGVKIKDTIPYNCTLTSILLSLSEAPTGSVFQANVKKNGTSIFSTKITIDVNELDNLTAYTPYALVTTPTLFSVGDRIEISIDAVGGVTTGKGAIIKFNLIKT